MTERDITRAELREVLDAPARRNPEQSRAHHKDTYRNPADHIKFPREQEQRNRKREDNT